MERGEERCSFRRGLPLCLDSSSVNCLRALTMKLNFCFEVHQDYRYIILSVVNVQEAVMLTGGDVMLKNLCWYIMCLNLDC